MYMTEKQGKEGHYVSNKKRGKERKKGKKERKIEKM